MFWPGVVTTNVPAVPAPEVGVSNGAGSAGTSYNVTVALPVAVVFGSSTTV